MRLSKNQLQLAMLSMIIGSYLCAVMSLAGIVAMFIFASNIGPMMFNFPIITGVVLSIFFVFTAITGFGSYKFYRDLKQLKLDNEDPNE